MTKMVVPTFNPPQPKHAACKLYGCIFYRNGLIAHGSFTLREWGILHFLWLAVVIVSVAESPLHTSAVKEEGITASADKSEKGEG